MKKLLILFLFLLSSLIIAGESVKEIPTATLAIQSAQSVYQNGDKVQILGEGFPADVEIVMAIISVQKTDGTYDYYILQNSDLQVNDGKLSGYIILEGLKENDEWGEILISTRGANVKATARFELSGNLPPAAPEGIAAGTFTFDENNGNGYAELNEQLDVTDQGSGTWVSPVFTCFRREYISGTPNGTPYALDINSLMIASGIISGNTNNGSQAYAAGTNEIDLYILDGSFTFSTSNNTVPTVITTDIDNFLVETENSQTEEAGTSFSVTVTARAGSNPATGYTGIHNLTLASDATASPDGTSPVIPASGDYDFGTTGVATIPGFTLYNSNPNTKPSITVSDPNVSVSDATGPITVNDGPATTEVRIKTVFENAGTDEEQYSNNIYGDALFQGPTQADPDKQTNLYGIGYDAYGNARNNPSGDWTASAGLDGSFLFPGIPFPANQFVFESGASAGTTYVGTITFDIGGGITAQTGTITVDDGAPGTVASFNVIEDDLDPHFVYVGWDGNSSGDDGTTGDPSGYEIRWRFAAFGPINTDAEWDLASSVGSGPAFSSGTWHLNMSGHPEGFKFFAMRTVDDVGNISGLAFTTSSDYSLPVDLVSFTSKAEFDKVVLEWETASEVNNEGFFLYRSSQSDDGYEQLNSVLIPGNGNSNTSHRYEYIDKNVVAGQTYFYKLISRDFNGDLTEYESIVSATVLVAPTTFSLAQNFPNPFNPETHFSFSIAEPSRASLKIYNSLGQAIRTIFQNKVFDVGVYDNYSWDATDDAGKQVANGIYYYELQIPEQNIRQVKKMLFLK